MTIQLHTNMPEITTGSGGDSMSPLINRSSKNSSFFQTAVFATKTAEIRYYFIIFC